MSRRRVYSDNTLAIMERFFTAFDIAVQNRLIKSIAEYCRDNSIAPPHFYTQRKDRNRGYFEVGWLVPLVRDCGISDRKSTRLNSSHMPKSRMPSSA